MGEPGKSTKRSYIDVVMPLRDSALDPRAKINSKILVLFSAARLHLSHRSRNTDTTLTIIFTSTLTKMVVLLPPLVVDATILDKVVVDILFYHTTEK